MGSVVDPTASANRTNGARKRVRRPRDETLQSRVHELEAVTSSLRRQVEASARRLQIIMGQLALAEERAGHQAMARAIRTIAAGQSNLSFEAAWALLGEESNAPRGSAPAPRLGAREREVLRLITEGNRSPCIAEQLGITVGTVEVHRRNIMRKLGLHSVAALTKYAVREGLTSL
ncbi:MAG TPA: LuxR C-terminal-related transcriptional regulator [Burkholderiales bacterium]|nr:LuxR C-terminal-related transcriptional regulator [Burkholderiales bacterium]